MARYYTITAVKATKSDSSKLKRKENCSKPHRLILKRKPIAKSNMFNSYEGHPKIMRVVTYLVIRDTQRIETSHVYGTVLVTHSIQN